MSRGRIEYNYGGRLGSNPSSGRRTNCCSSLPLVDFREGGLWKLKVLEGPDLPGFQNLAGLAAARISWTVYLIDLILVAATIWPCWIPSKYTTSLACDPCPHCH